MASEKKKFKAKKNAPTEKHLYAAFIGDLMAGDITATRLHETRDQHGHLELEYDDPNG